MTFDPLLEHHRRSRFSEKSASDVNEFRLAVVI